ncbi:MAG: hypothetical protein IJW59_02500 [Clostridia bacterium]|nr:hypothetical protein [Clostridia bacterium]
MKKDYVLNHDWGSYNSNDTINRLMLRNTDDFMKYFDNEMVNNTQYNADIVGKYMFKFEDGAIIQFVLEIVR